MIGFFELPLDWLSRYPEAVAKVTPRRCAMLSGAVSDRSKW